MNEFGQSPAEEGIESAESLKAQLGKTKRELKRMQDQARRLSRVTEVIADGHLFFYHPNLDNDDPDDPLVSLVRNFNTMIGKLKQAQSELETRVGERSAQLSEKTKALQTAYDQAKTLSEFTELIAKVVEEGKLAQYTTEIDDSNGSEDPIAILTRNFDSLIHNLKKSQENLEQKVSERTAELQEKHIQMSRTLKELAEIKTIQDGDYFLTKLLIKPLAVNESTGKNVKVEFMVHQKKTFQFRRWHEDLGGDICMAHTLDIAGKQHTIFFNGDAMGKSIQGAGGALVVGAVFRAHIQRTRHSSMYKSYYPERWLKNTLLELQAVFESFEGSMAMSAVVGLIDEESGFMYYLNAEHPWMALYRNGQATFLENKHLLHKLGMAWFQDHASIRTFQMEPGDIIISGSDGRDDFLIPNGDKEPMMNEDEDMFLRRVEEGEGDPERIYEAIKRQGTITDDISLLRISYRETGIDVDPPPLPENLTDLIHRSRIAWRNGVPEQLIEELERAIEQYKNEPTLMKQLIKSYIREHKFHKAAPLVQEFIRVNPGETEYVYAAAYCCKKIGKYDLAADLGERVLLREPNMAKNLANLADIYLHQKYYDRAYMLMERALSQDGKNPLALKIKHYMDEVLS